MENRRKSNEVDVPDKGNLSLREQELIDLIDDLMAPSFTFRLARKDPRNGAKTRMMNALTQMKGIVDKYVEHRYVQLHPRVQTNDYDPY